MGWSCVCNYLALYLAQGIFGFFGIRILDTYLFFLGGDTPPFLSWVFVAYISSTRGGFKDLSCLKLENTNLIIKKLKKNRYQHIDFSPASPYPTHSHVIGLGRLLFVNYRCCV